MYIFDIVFFIVLMSFYRDILCVKWTRHFLSGKVTRSEICTYRFTTNFFLKKMILLSVAIVLLANCI